MIFGGCATCDAKRLGFGFSTLMHFASLVAVLYGWDFGGSLLRLWGFTLLVALII
jgi:hypothetical protein